MYAIIKAGGKQYRVQKGDVIKVEKMNVEAGDTVTFDEVLLISDEKKVSVGAPVLKGASVEAKVVENGKNAKVIIYKYKPKKDFKKKQGHRQPYTMVEIQNIRKTAPRKKAEAAEAPAVAEAE